jgi:hypothetical protein
MSEAKIALFYWIYTALRWVFPAFYIAADLYRFYSLLGHMNILLLPGRKGKNWGRNETFKPPFLAVSVCDEKTLRFKKKWRPGWGVLNTLTQN